MSESRAQDAREIAWVSCHDPISGVSRRCTWFGETRQIVVTGLPPNAIADAPRSFRLPEEAKVYQVLFGEDGFGLARRLAGVLFTLLSPELPRVSEDLAEDRLLVIEETCRVSLAELASLVGEVRRHRYDQASYARQENALELLARERRIRAVERFRATRDQARSGDGDPFSVAISGALVELDGGALMSSEHREELDRFVDAYQRMLGADVTELLAAIDAKRQMMNATP